MARIFKWFAHLGNRHLLKFFIALLTLCPLSILAVFYLSMDAETFILRETVATPSEIALFSKCVMPIQPSHGWTPEVDAITNREKTPFDNCDKSYVPYTVLGENGTVWINEKHAKKEGIECYAGSVMRDTDKAIRTSDWFRLAATASEVAFTSDFVATKCVEIISDNFWFRKKKNERVTQYMHLQVWPEASPVGDEGQRVLNTSTVRRDVLERKPVTGNDSRPDVFILVIDSVPNTMALRALPRTIAFLKKKLGAINFGRMNQIAKNSRPNGYAMFLGQLVEPVERTFYDLPGVEIDMSLTTACATALNESKFIVSRFKKVGYTTFQAEDQGVTGTFRYPNCASFAKQPSDRYLDPFYLYMEKNFENKILPGCYFHYLSLFEYYEKFVKQYRDGVAKMSLIWTNVVHDDPDYLFHMDIFLLNFFQRHQEKFDNAYVILAADHGFRYGKLVHTSQSSYEMKNPMLYISVPKAIRERVTPRLKENSDKMLTAHDIYATLVNIVQDPLLKKDSGPTEKKWGNSLLHKLPEGERNCRTLPIPWQHCMCANKLWPDQNRLMSFFFIHRLSTYLIQYVNHMIQQEKMTDICHHLEFEANRIFYNVGGVKYIDATDGLYEVTAMAAPCGGEFSATIRSDSNGELSIVTGSIIRVNMYRQQADCLSSSQKGHMREFCCCKYN